MWNTLKHTQRLRTIIAIKIYVLYHDTHKYKCDVSCMAKTHFIMETLLVISTFVSIRD